MHRSGIFLVGVLMFVGLATAADETKKAPRFELKDGDRVVLLGGTLIEREQKYGHWEAMLTARYPDRNITFRNLGWDGDTVWAESRGIFDSPEVGYARMIEQVKGLKPTVIFLGYGNNEAFAGKDGLDPFIKQYEKLIDDLTKVSAEGVRFVLISPTFIEPIPAPYPNVGEQNKQIDVYHHAIDELAVRRGFRFVDIAAQGNLWDSVKNPKAKAKPLGWIGFLGIVLGGRQRDTQLRYPLFTDFGTAQSEIGYSSSSHILLWDLFSNDDEATPDNADSEEEQKRRSEADREPASIALDWNGKLERAWSSQVDAVTVEGDRLSFTATHRWMTFPSALVVSGLPEGRFALSIDGKPSSAIHTKAGGTAIFLQSLCESCGHSEGLLTFADVPHVDYNILRQAIIAKNELYFHSWRPQNVTYLFGFRKHEQGQNAKETAEFEKLVAEKEAEIARLKKPVPHKYELTREKPAK